jgi:hypothetical protein
MRNAAEPQPVPFKPTFDTAKALSGSVGVASPLWLAFAGAASAGVAYWWLTRWMRPANLEAAASGRVVAPEPELIAAPEPPFEPVEALRVESAQIVEAVETIVEPEPVTASAAPAIPDVAIPEAAMLEPAEPVVATPAQPTDPAIDVKAHVETAPAAAKPKAAAKPATKASSAAPARIVAPTPIRKSASMKAKPASTPVASPRKTKTTKK